jgi:hypothetical protein
MPYQTVYTTEITALSMSFKWAPIGTRVSVSKVLLRSFFIAAAKLGATVTVF